MPVALIQVFVFDLWINFVFILEQNLFRIDLKTGDGILVDRSSRFLEAKGLSIYSPIFFLTFFFFEIHLNNTIIKEKGKEPITWKL